MLKIYQIQENTKMLKTKDIMYNIDVIQKESGTLRVIGWANSANPSEEVAISVTDDHGNPIDSNIVRTTRYDVSMARYGKIVECYFGFNLTFPYTKNGSCQITFKNENDFKNVTINEKYIKLNHLRLKMAALRHAMTHKNKKDRNSPDYYDWWYRQVQPRFSDLVEQKTTSFPPNAPKFSIVIPLYNTPEKYLSELCKSIKNQTYRKFDVCFADGSPENHNLGSIINKSVYGDTRFHYKFIGENRGISGNTNEAVQMSTGDFIVLCDHDDLLTPNALFEFAHAIIKNPECDCLYSDEDKINEDGKLFDPHFKPDFDIDMLTSVNYICHLFAVRKTLIDKYGAFDSHFDGAQDYDFIFRMTEKSRKIVHVTKVLYHWRTHQESTSSNPESKLYAFTAGANAIRAHYQRVWPNIEIEKIDTGISYGIYHTYFKFTEFPLVSIIIPNKDHVEDLDKALRSVITKGSWKNLEIIVVENNSTETCTFEYYKNIVNAFPQVHVVQYEGEFNYSKINNFGAEFAHGSYLLFMNNDVELIEPDSIRQMMGYAQRDDVGIVGCRLLYEDDTIQHAGVIIGIGGVADHIFRGRHSENDTYFNRAMVAQDYSAVTAAVMLMKSDIFHKINGFDETFAVAFNDIDICLRTRKLNKLVVYTPYAAFHHYESKSRGYEDTYEKQLRFESEIKLFLLRWKNIIVKGDPYYNPNFTIRTNDYSLRDLSEERIGEPYYTRSRLRDILTLSPEEIVERKSVQDINRD